MQQSSEGQPLIPVAQSLAPNEGTSIGARLAFMTKLLVNVDRLECCRVILVPKQTKKELRRTDLDLRLAKALNKKKPF